MNPSDLPRQRLHPLAALLSALGTLRSLAPLLLVLLFTQRGEGSTPMLGIAVIALGASLVEGVGGWLRYSYWLVAGELRVERGFLVRQRITIPSARVQTVDISAGVLQRLFGLVKVEIKTAAGTQVVLSAIRQESAEALRQALSAASDQPEVGSEPQHHSFRLTTAELLLAASTSGRLGVILSAIGWAYSKVDDIVEAQLIELLSNFELAESWSGADPLIVAALILFGLLLAFVASVIAEVLRFGGFSVERTGDELVIRRGLFERREVTVRLERIQAIRIVEGLLRQPFGYAALVVETAGHADERGRSTELHPFLHRNRWLPLLEALAPEYAVAPSLERPPPRALRRFLLRPIVLGLGLVGALSVTVPFGWLSLLALALVPCLGLMSYRDAGVGTSGKVLCLRARSLRRVTSLVRRGRIQFTQSSTSWFQQRRQLADLSVAVASGSGGSSFSVPELDQALVERVIEWSRGHSLSRSDDLPAPPAQGTLASTES